jgi:transcriptional regulator with XRE-family HTH domain
MVATDNRFVINRKIENIILLKGLSPSHFADDINVPRSSISHILADRNKPSLEIIHKIIKRYPDISFDWLMDGVEDNNEIDIQKPVNQADSRYKRTIKPDLDFNTKNNPEPVAARSNVERYKNRLTERSTSTTPSNFEKSDGNINTPNNKVVARVMVFYTDNTFDTFESK